MLAKLGERILDWIYPPRCIFCEQILPIYSERHCCAICREHLPWTKEENGSDCLAPLAYEGMVQNALYRFKYGGHREYGKSFASLVIPYAKEHLTGLPIDLLIPVPLHPKRQKKRGYNQAEEIGKELAKKLGIPLETNVLSRIKNTPPQSKLSPRARQNNMKEAFSVVDFSKVKGKVILIIDDIYTTGSTMEACKQELLHCGAKKVYLLTISKAYG
ncbi:MAG: ComF family protein [Epulopiscium sp.]|nr:ComF family protein [Candidatus Epulonipiscium sp.]